MSYIHTYNTHTLIYTPLSHTHAHALSYTQSLTHTLTHCLSLTHLYKLSFSLLHTYRNTHFLLDSHTHTHTLSLTRTTTTNSFNGVQFFFLHFFDNFYLCLSHWGIRLVYPDVRNSLVCGRNAGENYEIFYFLFSFLYLFAHFLKLTSVY